MQISILHENIVVIDSKVGFSLGEFVRTKELFPALSASPFSRQQKRDADQEKVASREQIRLISRSFEICAPEREEPGIHLERAK